MFWEIKEYFRKLFSMTVCPAMKNLFSSKKSAVGMLCVMLILQTLLSIICISGVENIKTQSAILEDHQANLEKYSDALAPDEIVLGDPEEESTTEQASQSSQEGSAYNTLQTNILSSDVSAALNGAPIFAGFICLWVITAIIVYQRISSASADRDKYMWGMYITYGAQKKKVRNILKYELYSVLTVATVPSYFLALFICNRLVEKQGYSYGFNIVPLLIVLVLSYICIRLVVSYEVKLISSRSCVYLLKEEDGPSKLCAPRRPGKLRKGFSPFRYAATSFVRLRKYYLLLALAAAIPAIIWLCCQTAAYSQSDYLSSDIEEYRITFKKGVSESDFKKVYSKDLSEIYGISSLKTNAVYPADKVSLFLLADRSQYNDDATEIIHGYDVYADGDAYFAPASQALQNRIGFNARISEGSVFIIYPSDTDIYDFNVGSKLCVAVSRLTGEIRTDITDVNTALKSDLDNEYEYMLFDIKSVQSLRRTYASNNFINIDKPYFVFHENDYEKITSVSASSFAHDISNADITVGKNTYFDGSFDITFKLSELDTLPSPGDTIEVSKGSIYYHVTLTTEEETFDKYQQLEFNTVNINNVTVSGELVTLRVSPRTSITMKTGLSEDSVHILFGLPEQVLGVKDKGIYLPHECSDTELQITSPTGAQLNFKEALLYTDPAVRSIDAGTHLKLGENNFKGNAKDDKLFVESLYGSNLFDIVCGDEMNTSSLGINFTVKNKGDAVIILPTGYAYEFDFSVGDTLRINKTHDNVSNYEPGLWMAESENTALEAAMSYEYEFVKLKISDIVYSDTIERPQIVVSDEDFSAAISKSAPYTNISVFLDKDLSSDKYAALHDSLVYEINQLNTSNKDGNTATIESRGEFLDFLLKKNSNYGLWISLIGMLIPMTLPFIWYYPQATLFERRKFDYITLRNIGKKKGQIRAIFFIEGLMVSLTALAAIALLCYPGMYAFDLICFAFDLPLEFDISYLTATNLAIACLGGFLCSVISFVICYFIAAPRKQKTKRSERNKNYADT